MGITNNYQNRLSDITYSYEDQHKNDFKKWATRIAHIFGNFWGEEIFARLSHTDEKVISIGTIILSCPSELITRVKM